MIEILEAGAETTVQDLGRVGYSAWGIAGGGAADRGSLRLANRLVGNPEDAAAFEVLLGGLAFRCTEPTLVAVTGAPAPVVVGGTRLGRLDGPQWLPPGATVTLGRPPVQLRSYVAVRGGLDTVPVLGSRSVDEPSGIGRALRPGDTVPVGRPVPGAALVDQAPRPAWPSGPLTLHGTCGPRDDWFTEATLAHLQGGPYTVQPASDRIGVRLAGPPLERRHRRELLSEPTVRGAVEVPADGQPIVFGAGHPTTCGYPVVAVLDPAGADLLAQCRPGQAVTFRLRRPAVRLATRPADPGRPAP